MAEKKRLINLETAVGRPKLEAHTAIVSYFKNRGFHLLGEYASSLDSTLIGPANFAKKARNNRLEPAPRSVLGIILFFYCIIEPNKRTLKRGQLRFLG